MGFHNNISPEQIFTSLSAARRILVERQLNPLLLVDEEAKEDLEVLSRGIMKTPILLLLSCEGTLTRKR